MMSQRITSAVLALLLAAPVLGSAQSLGEVAKREQEKQEKKKKDKEKGGKAAGEVKVYTEEDLKKARESTAGNLTILPDTGAAASAAASSEEAAALARETMRGGDASLPADESGWRARTADRRNAVRVAESKVQTLEAQIAGLRNDMTITNTQDPNRLQTQGRELADAQANLESAKRELDAARQALAGLEDEARRAGAMPGWVR
jgi:predicted  nucleic acid-binding Zn-ribbon protein